MRLQLRSSSACVRRRIHEEHSRVYRYVALNVMVAHTHSRMLFQLIDELKPLTVELGRGRSWRLSPAQLWYNTRQYPFFPSVCALYHTAIPCYKGIIRTVAVNDIACKIGTTVNSNVCETRRSSLHHFEARPDKTLNRPKVGGAGQELSNHRIQMRIEIWMPLRLKLREQVYQRFAFLSPFTYPHPQWFP
jgi:hypothetical protein